MIQVESLIAEELEVEAVGAELFRFRAATDLTAASLSGVITERIGAPLQIDSERATAKAVSWVARLDGADARVLRRATEITRRYLRFEVGKLADAGNLHRFDMQVTPYRIGMMLAEVHRYMESYVFADAVDLDRYAILLHQYQIFLAGTVQNLREQAAMGIVAPASALPGCLGVVEGLTASCAQYVRVAPERLAHVPQARRSIFLARLERAIEKLHGAFDELRAYLRGGYARHAPESVGLSQYSGGREAYETLIRHHTTLELSAEEVHRRGVDLVCEIEEDMTRLRGELEFKGSGRDFLAQINGDRRFHCTTPEEVGELYLRLMRKCEAVLSKAFGARTFPAFGVKRLPAEAESGMTFGYYQPPAVGGEQVGYYRYNGSSLDQRLMIGAAGLIYHELVPGHHLHLSTEMGDASRLLVRRMPTITAFSEGWAEYAADLGFELGLYEDPYDRYGRYLLQLFLATRLVVDTGLNALGWTSQRARDYLLEHTALSAIEIESEILRYATGLPGQALAYAPGRKHFWQIRQSAEKRMSSHFDLPAFHAAILDGGSLALADLTFSIEQWVAGQAGSGECPVR